MFVYTLKASGIKFFAAVALSVAVLVTAVSFLPDVAAASDAAAVATDYDSGGSVEEIRELLGEFGYEVSDSPVKQMQITIPNEFNSVYERYNDIQRAQGLNLKRYKGKTAEVFVFSVSNYGGEGRVYATVFVRNGRIIAGDICSPDGEGFIHGFKKL